jgi:outer membrane lipopolysaccharide assembly protein LptE/RlpB
MPNFFRIRFLALAVVLTLSGCGYAFQGSGSVLPADVRSVYVPIVENNSTEIGLNAMLTEAIRDRFERFGVVRVVEDMNDADAVLRARILRVKKGTASVTSGTDTALQQDLVMTVAAELRRVTGPVLWRASDLTVSKSIGATSGAVVTSSADFASGGLGAGDVDQLDSREVSRGQEAEAMQQLAEDTAKRIYDEAVAPDF